MNLSGWMCGHFLPDASSFPRRWSLVADLFPSVPVAAHCLVCLRSVLVLCDMLIRAALLDPALSLQSSFRCSCLPCASCLTTNVPLNTEMTTTWLPQILRNGATRNPARQVDML